MEVHHLQDVCREPGHYYKDGNKESKEVNSLLSAGLIQYGGSADPRKLYPTKLGEQVLKDHLPFKADYMNKEVMPEHRRSEKRIHSRQKSRWN